jgi:hypothetical protein
MTPSHPLYTFRQRRALRRGVIALAALSMTAYGGVRAAISGAASVWNPVQSLSPTPRFQAGAVGPITLQKPFGKSTFNVTFPEIYKVPPKVVLTVSGDSEIPVNIRLLGQANVGGFRAIAQAQYFTQQQTTTTITVNWMALGDGIPPAK